MKSLLLVCSFMIVAFSGHDYQPDKKEARSAYDYLQKIRANPENFVSKFPFLKGMKQPVVLKWNDTLAKVAEARAMDLAKRNYMGHTDPDGYGVNHYIDQAGYKLESAWLKEKNANYFESLNAGSGSGIASIESLLVDAGTPSLGHRKHLMGIESWNASLQDIGIGYVAGDAKTSYVSYTCIIIAKHNW